MVSRLNFTFLPKQPILCLNLSEQNDAPLPVSRNAYVVVVTTLPLFLTLTGTMAIMQLTRFVDWTCPTKADVESAPVDVAASELLSVSTLLGT